MGSAIANNAKPNFNISNGSNGQYMKFLGSQSKGSSQLFTKDRVAQHLQDQELIEELAKANFKDSDGRKDTL